MKKFVILILIVTGFGFAEDWPKDKTVGYRGDTTGNFPGTNPPITWSRIAVNSIVKGLYCSPLKPKGEGKEGVLMDDGIPRDWLVLGPLI